MSESYVKVRGEFQAATNKGVLVRVNGKDRWIPRSVIHMADDFRLHLRKRGDEITLRVMEWKASEIEA
jgi:hypothetical protein